MSDFQVKKERCPWCQAEHPSQPPPKANDSEPVWELVVKDMQRRDHFGRAKYGTPVQAGNGRDALQDAYEEILDAAVYLKQAIIERDAAKQV